MYKEILVKLSNIKLHESPLNISQIVSYGRTGNEANCCVWRGWGEFSFADKEVNNTYIKKETGK
jgi:hypothetical protein